MTKLSFKGTEQNLKIWLADHGILGDWSDEPNGVKMLRCGNSAQIHWSSTKGSLWVSGKPDVRTRMQTRLEHASVSEDDDYPDFDWID